MNKNSLHTLFCALIALFAMTSCDWGMQRSPNGRLVLVHDVSPSGALCLTLYHNSDSGKVEVMNVDHVGIDTESDHGESLIFKEVTGPVHHVDDYTMISGKRSQCHNEANEYTYRLEDFDGNEVRLVVRLYNDGLAFRYETEALEGEVVTGEHTRYAFADGIKRWTQPYAVGYEDFYFPNTDGVAHNRRRHWNLPALFQPGDDTYVLLAEANVLRDQCGAYLTNRENASMYEVKLVDDRFTCPAEWKSPWRLAIVGSLADVVESTLVTDVSDPCQLEDTSWIKPGIVSWVYWAHNHGSQDYQIVKQYIDFADTLGLPYVLIDAEWDVMHNGGTLPDALAYSRSKGVAPIIWYNSSTAWISGPGPGYRLNDPESRDQEFAWIRDMGVKGVKVDFFGADSIGTMNYYLDILDAAAKHQIMVNFHGATIPRGWQRTYPHFMTSEAVYGAEWYNNNGRLTPNAAWHNSTLPFTRNVIGPMDYTPCAFTDSQHPHITTHAHELALTIVFESALQHLADRPTGFLDQPAEVQQLITDLPTAWDDTKLLSGYPGKWVAMARRSGETWYVGIINGLDTEQSIAIDWSFLGNGKYNVQGFGDVEGEARAWNLHSQSSAKVVTMPDSIHMAARGGYVAILKAEK